jgi:hypothetical protein
MIHWVLGRPWPYQRPVDHRASLAGVCGVEIPLPRVVMPKIHGHFGCYGTGKWPSILMPVPRRGPREMREMAPPRRRSFATLII